MKNNDKFYDKSLEELRDIIASYFGSKNSVTVEMNGQQSCSWETLYNWISENYPDNFDTMGSECDFVGNRNYFIFVGNDEAVNITLNLKGKNKEDNDWISSRMEMDESPQQMV